MMNAAAGIFLAARRKKGWTNSYVTDGLIAMWDGEWNAGGGVHDPAATTWVDLSGTGNDLTVTAPAYFDANSFHVNRVYRAAYLPASFIGGTIWTLEFCGREMKNDGGIAFGIGYPRYIAHGTNYIECFGRNGHGFVVENEETFSGGMVYVNVDNAYGKLYKNGVAVSSTVLGPYYSSLGTNGFGPRNGYNSSAVVHCVRAYSRALTAEEIEANYAVDKARFNLP